MARDDDSAVPEYSQLLRLDDRGFVVVGAGRGMGRQSAHALAQQGARVVCVDIVGERAQDVAAEVKGVPVVADARREDDVADLFTRAQRELGSLDGVVDVVGMARWAMVTDMTAGDWDWTLDMCLRHAFNVCKHGGRALAEAGGGSMVFITSVDGWLSAPFHAAYGAAKAGLLNLTQTLAMEWAPAVRVNAVTAGLVKTEQSHLFYGDEEGIARVDATVPMGRMADPGDVGQACLFLASPAARYISGSNLLVHGGGERPPYIGAAAGQ